MKYCLRNHQRDGSCYFEFQQGQFTNQFWLDHSIYLSVDIFDRLQLRKLFGKIIPDFDYYGITEVNREDWENLMTAAENTAAKPVLDELNQWVIACFKTDDVFTILGI